MHDPKAVIDLHERSHECLKLMMEHCEGFTNEQMHQQIEGFGFSSIQSQLFHIIDCEDWWVGGITGLSKAEEKSEQYTDIDSLTGYREKVLIGTTDFLDSVSVEEFNSAQLVRLIQPGGKSEQLLTPARVIFHVQSHSFHHKGQIAAMCRLLGRAAPETDLRISG